MELHVRFLATATIVFGAATGFLALIALIYFEGFGGLWSWGDSSGGFGLVVLGSVLFHLLVAVPMIVCGVALRVSFTMLPSAAGQTRSALCNELISS